MMKKKENWEKKCVPVHVCVCCLVSNQVRTGADREESQCWLTRQGISMASNGADTMCLVLVSEM